MQAHHTGPVAHHIVVRRHSPAAVGHTDVAAVAAEVDSLAVDSRPAHSLAAVGSPGLEVGIAGSLGCAGRRGLT